MACCEPIENGILTKANIKWKLAQTWMNPAFTIVFQQKNSVPISLLLIMFKIIVKRRWWWIIIFLFKDKNVQSVNYGKPEVTYGLRFMNFELWIMFYEF